MKPALILGTAAVTGAAAGFTVTLLVTWEVAEFILRHSRYRNYSIGHLIRLRHWLKPHCPPG